MLVTSVFKELTGIKKAMLLQEAFFFEFGWNRKKFVWWDSLSLRSFLFEARFETPEIPHLRNKQLKSSRHKLSVEALRIIKSVVRGLYLWIIKLVIAHASHNRLNSNRVWLVPLFVRKKHLS